MFKVKMIPGQTPYTEEEQRLANLLIRSACKAEEIYTEQELEDAAKEYRKQENGQRLG